METTNDIVREVAAEMLNTSMQDITAETICNWANRLGDAATCEKSSQVGNAAKMREALTKAKEWMERRIATRGFETSATFPTMLEDVVLPALAAPPRNCDLFTNAQDALATIHNDRCYVQNPIDERSLTVKWLFAEAMQSYYACASDLIDGTGFKEVEGGEK